MRNQHQFAAKRFVKSKLLDQLTDCRSGVAYIEFAYSLPIFILLCMYGVELANIAITNARVSNITSMMADGAARVRDRIDEADINELMVGAKFAGQGINITKYGRIIISTVEDNAATASPTDDQTVTWQRCKGEQVPTGVDVYAPEGSTLTSGVGPTGQKIVAKPGNPVIFAQIIYKYQPIISNRFFGPITMNYSSAFTVRDRVVQTMQNGGALANSSKSLCTAYNV